MLSACAFLLLANLGHAQQLDVAVGGSTLFSSSLTNASQAYLPSAEKGGVYPGFSVDYFRKNSPFGFNAEFSFRDKQGFYNGYQAYRPVFYDVNALYTRRLNKLIIGDVMAGVGGETLIFYNTYRNCFYSGGCTPNVNSTHLALHLGGDLRYYFWRNFFVRPEAHYYYVHNNFQFRSDNVARVGASIGYTFGRKLPAKKTPPPVAPPATTPPGTTTPPAAATPPAAKQ
jgi:hypothetical protein